MWLFETLGCFGAQEDRRYQRNLLKTALISRISLPDTSYIFVLEKSRDGVAAVDNDDEEFNFYGEHCTYLKNTNFNYNNTIALVL